MTFKLPALFVIARINASSVCSSRDDALNVRRARREQPDALLVSARISENSVYVHFGFHDARDRNRCVRCCRHNQVPLQLAIAADL